VKEGKIKTEFIDSFVLKGYTFASERKLISALLKPEEEEMLVKTCLSNSFLLVVGSSNRLRDASSLPATLKLDAYDLGRMQHILKFASYVAAILQRLTINLSLHVTALHPKMERNKDAEYKRLMDSVIAKFFSPALLNHYDFNRSIFKIDQEVRPSPQILFVVLGGHDFFFLNVDPVHQVHHAAYQGSAV